MNSRQIHDLLVESQLIAIPTKEGIDETQSGIAFKGTLEEFISTIKQLQCTFVFTAFRELANTDFMYRDNERRSINGKIQLRYAVVDLSEHSDDLKSLKSKVGECCGMRLWAVHGAVNLQYAEYQEWWSDFESVKEQAIEQYHSVEDKVWAEKEYESERQAESTKAKMREFINDSVFVALPTIRAMQAYIAERVPEIVKLEPKVLREEMQSINGIVVAKGLGKKKSNK